MEELLAIATEEPCFDVQFHPGSSLLAAATVSGEVELHSFDISDIAAPSSSLVRKLRSHQESCRTAQFLAAATGGDAAGGGGSTCSSTAARLITASADKFAAMSDVETGQRLWRAKLRDAGNVLLPLDAETFVVGDDGGGIALHDVRKKKAVVRYAVNEDFISGMVSGTDESSLCATSGDGTLAVYDLRKSGEAGLIALSDFQEDEYLSLAIVKEGTKVVCGSQTGILSIFTWGDFGDLKDRIKGHPMSVDAMIHVAEDGVVTGSSDGRIRVVSVHGKEHGNSVLGVIGEHGDYPVESLALSPDGKLLASASPHGQPALRLWWSEPAEKLLRGKKLTTEEANAASAAGAGDDSSDEDEPKKKRRKKKCKKGPAGTESSKKAGAFFADL